MRSGTNFLDTTNTRGRDAIVAPARHWKPRIGCSSIALGATPLVVVEVEEHDPGDARSRARWQRAASGGHLRLPHRHARLSQVGAGDSAIIVRCPSLSTTWKSSSASLRCSPWASDGS
jgi:hypothetical protein